MRPNRTLVPIAVAFLTISPVANARDWYPVDNAVLVTTRTRVLANDLNDIGSKSVLTDCGSMVREPEGRLGSAWGAICTLTASGKVQQVMLCNDDVVGYFALQAKTFVHTNDYVARFMENNCMGG